jgi:hypothetical protein
VLKLFFVKFIPELYSHWAAAWLGTVSLIIAIVLWVIRVKELSWGGFALAAFVCFVIAAFQTWNVKRERIQTLESINAKPSFKGEVEIIYAADSEPYLTVNTQTGEKRIFTWRFIALVTVVNTTSAASSIRKFSMKITSEKERHIPSLDSIPPIDSGFEVWPCDDALSPILKFADFPPVACSERLEQGHHQTGWIAFELKNSHLNVSAEQVRYDISLVDAYGELHVMSCSNTQWRGAVYRPANRF